MKNRYAFTMIELIFVIVIMGIIGKFGTEFLAQAYKNFISTKIHNKFQNQSSTAVEFIAKRLQYRIKSSVIVREIGTFSDFELLEGFQSPNYNVMEWISYDSEGLRDGAWSGIYSKEKSGTELYSPETNTTQLNNLISTLSNTNSSLANAAIYFIGSDSSKDSWGWGGVAFTDFNNSMKPIKAGTSLKEFASDVGSDFSTLNLNNSLLNSYQLAWTANAIVFDETNQQLWLYTDYQPWEGDKYTDANIKQLIMEEISDFKKKQTKSIITIKVCSINEKLKDLDEGDFGTCKEKTIL
ncbi:MAG: prepilin-type N-terminal cleavage/methylation domain-containing protein [Campylobacterota bacterium]|nr:prepilin-type N-terminal cleavage/methylation domain-containing protein [Campylobacterota bacterium]